MIYTLHMIHLDYEDCVETEFILFSTTKQYKLLESLREEIQQYDHLQIVVWDENKTYLTNNYDNIKYNDIPNKIKRFFNKVDAILIMDRLTEEV